MRVISGSCRGRKLVELKGKTIRPTSDRIREAIFNILGPLVKKARVLDLFAGTGAMGIEALSRGACHVTFIDISCDVTRENLKRCRMEENVHVIPADLVRDPFPKSLSPHPFDIVFIDPPYGKGWIEKVVQKASFLKILTKDCLIIAEHSHKENLEISSLPLDISRQKKYSKTVISFINKIN